MDTFEKETQKEIPYSDLAIMNKLLSYNFVEQNRMKKANDHLEIRRNLPPPSQSKKQKQKRIATFDFLTALKIRVKHEYLILISLEKY